MSPEELDSLAIEIENNLKRDLVLLSGFQSTSVHDQRRAKKVLAVKILCLLNTSRFFILSLLCLFPSSKTSTNFRMIFVDTFSAFGSFGCLCNQMLLLGFTFLLNFSHVMHKAEKNGQLAAISHIKDHRKFRLTPVETIKFARYLKWMRTIRYFYIYMILPSVVSFLAVAGYLSSLKVQSLIFITASIFVTLINCTQTYFGCVWCDYTFMMPVHSNNVLSILLKRLLGRIEHLTRAHNFIGGHLKPDSEIGPEELSVKLLQWVKRAQQQVKKRHEILKISENVLREIDLHNQTIKHILDKVVSCGVPGIGLSIVFFVGNRGDLWHHMFSAVLALTSFIIYVSFLKSRDVYTLSQKLSSNLHSIQVRLRGKGMKSQLQILRLIQRTSDCESWNHSIGFTVGNRGSLSSKLVLSAFFQTMTIALTFLNARSTWRQHEMSA